MDKILVLDFGGQYNQLIARRVRENHIYAEIRAYNRITVDEIRNQDYKGIIFTGGPNMFMMMIRLILILLFLISTFRFLVSAMAVS